MPQLEPKLIQKELEQNLFWPVYWIHGQEKMKSRELLKRIKKSALPESDSQAASGLFSFGSGEETFDGAEVSASEVIDAARSLTLGGGLRFIVVRDAQDMKEPELLSELLGPKAPLSELSSICVFLSKDLDMRKKSSKLLIEKAAVVPCEEVAESDREAWVEYLAKQRKMTLDASLVTRMRSLDPWSLDIIDQELEKLSLSGDTSGDVLLIAGAEGSPTDQFIHHLFSRSSAGALQALQHFAQEPEESIPLLGLIGWNAKHLAQSVAQPGKNKVNPYLAERLKKWTPLWTLSEVQELQNALCELDFCSKQTPLSALGLWSELAMQFGR